MKKINGIRAAVYSACVLVAAHAGVAASATTAGEARLPVREPLANIVDSVFSYVGPAAGVVGLGMAAALFLGDVTDGTRKFLQRGLWVAGIVGGVSVIQGVLTAGALI